MLVRWTPFSELGRLQSELDKFFDGSFGPVAKSHGEASAWSPAVDLAEDAEKIVLTADLPGVDQQGLDIQVEKNILTLKGERKLQRSEPAGELHRRYERIAGSFSRSFRLPETVDAQKIAAALKDGVLTVTLPKRPETQPHKVKVSVQ